MNDEQINAPAGAAESATPTSATPAPSAPVSGSPPESGTPEGVGSDAAPAQGTPTDEPPLGETAHSYDLEQHAHLIGTRGEGAGYLQDFGNSMHAAEVPEAAVHGTLKFFETMVTGRATWDGLIDAHQGNPATIAPAIGWFIGQAKDVDDTPPTRGQIEAARGYVRHLPPEVILALEHKGRDGKALGNSHRAIKVFAEAASGATPPRAKEAAPMTSGPNAEREQIETAMRERRHEYNRDPGMQQRYREIVTGTAQARPANSPDSEIAVIEKTMRENRTNYNRDENMQRRYRQLLAARMR